MKVCRSIRRRRRWMLDDVGIGDRTNMAFMNSKITYGRGVGVVDCYRMQTEVGRIAGMINSAEETNTPLQENLKVSVKR